MSEFNLIVAHFRIILEDGTETARSISTQSSTLECGMRKRYIRIQIRVCLKHFNLNITIRRAIIVQFSIYVKVPVEFKE